MKRLFLPAVFACAFFASAPASAQISHGGTPPGLDPDLATLLSDEVPIEVLTEIDVEALRAEDLVNDQDKSIPWRFGADVPVQISLQEAGSWEALPGGDRVWRVAIRSPGAVSLSLAFDRFVMPPGGELYVRTEDGRDWIGAFTDSNNKADGRFATTLLYSDAIVIEYLEPADAPFPGEVSLLRVTHGYRDARSTAEAAWNNSGACQNNVACSIAAGWDDEIRSVAKYTMGGSLCTGALINNTANDGTPYFLTANHCYSNPSYWVFWFNYESPDCSNPSWEPSYDSVSSASHRASSSNSDFALVELSSAPPASYEVYYAGWSRSGSAASSAVGIHHPGGDIKKFSVEGSQIGPSGNYWDVGPWDDGTTEGGSSGSPLFDQNHRIVGQLYGGSSACWGSGENNGSDIYGRLDVSWTGSGSSSRLSDWLDPTGSGATSIDGHDPNGPTAAIDAGVTVVSPGAGSVQCTTSVEAEVQLTNHGSQALTSATIDYRVDGGSWATESWSGSLSQGASATVSLGDLSVSAGSHTLEVEVDPAGVDENPANDDATVTFEVMGSGGGPSSVSQGFEGGTFPPSGWSLANPDDAEAWSRTTSAGAFGGSSASAHFDNFEDDYRGEVDYLYSPFVDLSSASSPTLAFDVAYARYSGEYSDGLTVHVSDDCGTSWEQVYNKSGTTLATASDHSDPFVPTSGEWRTETVSLASWAGEATVLVVFGNVTGYGNNLFLDDVTIGPAGAGDDDDAASDDDDAWPDDDDASDDDDAWPDDDDASSDDDDAATDDDDDDDDAATDDDDTGGGSAAAATNKGGEQWQVEAYCGCDAGARDLGPPSFAWLLALTAAGWRRRR